MKVSKKEKAEAVAWIRKHCPPRTTIYTVLRHVSRSGMFRRIDLYFIEDGRPWFLTGWASKVLGWSWDRDKGGIKVSGCGMDMGFHLVYKLSASIYRNEDGSYSHEGAYSLKQEWL